MKIIMKIICWFGGHRWQDAFLHYEGSRFRMNFARCERCHTVDPLVQSEIDQGVRIEWISTKRPDLV